MKKISLFLLTFFSSFIISSSMNLEINEEKPILKIIILDSENNLKNKINVMSKDLILANDRIIICIQIDKLEESVVQK